MPVMVGSKGIWIAVLVATVALARAGETPKKTNSLFLSSDAFMASQNSATRPPSLQVDRRNGGTIEYSLATPRDLDRREFSLTTANCGAVLGIIAAVGGLALLRDRLFSAYR